jgi:hypothetical protein
VREDDEELIEGQEALADLNEFKEFQNREFKPIPIRPEDKYTIRHEPTSVLRSKEGFIPVYREPDPNMQDIEYAAANHFFADIGLPLTPDAVDQLVVAFIPALKVICERGYHPEGNTWREAGWRGVLTDIRKKSNRLWYRSWIKGGFDEDSATDLINFAGFYKRLRNQGPEWGTWGPPGGKEDPMGREADHG